MGTTSISLFLLAALMIAVIPGPGISYVAARTLSGGRQAGIASTFGTALGGLVHVVAGAVGVSAIIVASAELFTVLKLIGALYLIWLGIRTFPRGRQPLARAGQPRRSTAIMSRRRRGRGVQSQDGSILSGVHSAIRRRGGRPPRAPVHRARPDLGGA